MKTCVTPALTVSRYFTATAYIGLIRYIGRDIRVAVQRNVNLQVGSARHVRLTSTEAPPLTAAIKLSTVLCASVIRGFDRNDNTPLAS